MSNNYLTKRTGIDYHDIELFKDVNPLDWEDWRWQMRNRIRAKEALAKVINLTKEEEGGIKKSSGKLGLAITPHLATLMDSNDPNCPIRRQFVSLSQEFQVSPHEMSDPCAEDRDSLSRAWCIAIRTGSCFWLRKAAPPTAATAPAEGWWGISTR